MLVIWNRRQGWNPRADLRLFSATTVISVFCNLPFLWLIPRVAAWTDEMGNGLVRGARVWLVACWFLTSAVVIPAVLGLVASALFDEPTNKVTRWAVRVFNLDRISRAASAWDVVWAGRQGRFVVVTLEPDGNHVGGRFGTESAVAFWSDGHDLFLEEEWTVNDSGRFTAQSAPVVASGGIWLSGNSIRVVRFVGAEG
jgi:Family of unknown function (DUF6338)